MVAQTAQVGYGDRRKQKSKTGERCRYQTAQVGHGDGQREKEKIVATAQLMLALIKGVVNVGVALFLKPILKSWQLCLSFKLDVLMYVCMYVCMYVYK